MRKYLFVLALFALSSCGGSDGIEVTGGGSGWGAVESDVSDAIKSDGKGVYKVGNPYEINGIWYYPKEDYAYKETGVASWYGPDFHNGVTANGELYDMHGLTGAHRTLPLPSMVRVTNLKNGRSVNLRVNDRGPFVNDRIIDVSKRAAQLLGFYSEGTTDVMVEVLPEESKKLRDELMAQGLYSNFGLVDSNDRGEVVESPISDAAEAPKPAVKTVNIKPSTLPKGIYIQVGAFSDYRNATKAERALKGMGTVYIYQIYVNDMMLYRVRLGIFANNQEATGTLGRVRLKGYKDARIVEEKEPLRTPIGKRFDESM